MVSISALQRAVIESSDKVSARSRPTRQPMLYLAVSVVALAGYMPALSTPRSAPTRAALVRMADASAAAESTDAAFGASHTSFCMPSLQSQPVHARCHVLVPCARFGAHGCYMMCTCWCPLVLRLMGLITTHLAPESAARVNRRRHRCGCQRLVRHARGPVEDQDGGH